ncbi:molybdopterin-guanine dinucleotide biosynthesis protein B [Paenibacillus sp. AD87]|uniref:molybdopterin-guanine dinucleotide biosynthesis protein B n=1 Tax=Paenibacillus sp. AD87 TaxID=1528787 RepID=UPI0007E4763B|nr:molybdopterin-guanine dinucleotide biosynthesis protein B [Paenibacillus sp. AD87]OAX48022.1 Molybdopterin-guanine dinucleotide biosynthesis adapter protein [Paenibacillus sp. AD87]
MAETSSTSPHIMQIVGYKNTGKSTLIAALTRYLTSAGRRVAVIKHDGHDHFEMDHEGTDSYSFAQAGADAVVVMSEKRTALIERQATPLEDMIKYLSAYDWILIEGYKQAPYPKLVMVREEKDLSLLETLQDVVGIVSWLKHDKSECVEEREGLVWHSVHETEDIARWLVSLEGHEEKRKL